MQARGSLEAIFGASLRAHFGEGFLPDVAALASGALPAAVVRLHTLVAETFLPSPARPHHCLTLRDLGRLVHGLLRAQPSEVPNAGTVL